MGKRIGGETGTGYDHIMSHWGDWSGVELGWQEHTTMPLIEMGSHELFAWAGLELWSSWCQELLLLVARITGLSYHAQILKYLIFLQLVGHFRQNWNERSKVRDHTILQESEDGGSSNGEVKTSQTCSCSSWSYVGMKWQEVDSLCNATPL
jgi:hypothetical protein